jgi:signal transduction histidine kinase
MSLLNNLNVGLLYIAFAAIPLIIAAISWRNRETPGATPLASASVATATAIVIQGFRYIEPLVDLGLWVDVGLHAGLLVAINLAVLGTLYIAVEYTGQRWLIQGWFVLALAVFGAVLPTLRIPAEEAGIPAATVVADVDFTYRLVLAVSALLLFARQFITSHGVYRKQSGTLFLGLLVGSLFGLLERFYIVEYFEFTLVGMTLGYVVLTWSLFRYELLEAVPIARESLFDQVTDPVVALDGQHRVVDLNHAAYETFAVSDDVIGSDSGELFRQDETLASRYAGVIAGSTAVGGVVADGSRHFDTDHPVVAALSGGSQSSEGTLGLLLDERVRYFQVTVSTLELAPRYEGQLVVFRDVTESKEREQDLDIIKQVLTRVLRHNLRNDVSVIRGYANTIVDATDGEIQHRAERITAMTTDLMETSETARSIEDVIDADGLEEFDLAATLGSAVAEMRERYPEASIESRISSDVTVECNPQLPAALSEILENAVVHTGESPEVTITGERSGRWYDLTVSDTGPGIPDHELQTLNQGEETQLVHGSGAGLWLIHLVVEDSNGDVSYETGSEGTHVCLRLPVAAEGGPPGRGEV